MAGPPQASLAPAHAKGVMHLNAVPIQERPETVAFAWPVTGKLHRDLRVDGYLAEKVADREVFELV